MQGPFYLIYDATLFFFVQTFLSNIEKRGRSINSQLYIYIKISPTNKNIILSTEAAPCLSLTKQHFQGWFTHNWNSRTHACLNPFWQFSLIQFLLGKSNHPSPGGQFSLLDWQQSCLHFWDNWNKITQLS